MGISQKTKDALAKKVGGQFNSKIQTSTYKPMDLSRFGVETPKPFEKKVIKIKRKEEPKVEAPIVIEEKIEKVVETVEVEETPSAEIEEVIETTEADEAPAVQVFTSRPE